MQISNNHSQEEAPLEQQRITALGGTPNRLQQDTIPQQNIPPEAMAALSQQPMLQQQAVSPLAVPTTPPGDYEPMRNQQPQQEQQQEQQPPQQQQTMYDNNNTPQDIPYTPTNQDLPNAEGVQLPDDFMQQVANGDRPPVNPNIPIENQKILNPAVLEGNPDLLAELLQDPEMVDEVWDEISY